MDDKKKHSKEETSPGTTSEQPYKMRIDSPTPPPSSVTLNNNDAPSTPAGFAIPQYVGQYVAQQSSSPILTGTQTCSGSAQAIDSGMLAILEKLSSIES